MAKAQKGDLIRITNPCEGDPYKIGEIYEVVSVDEVFDEYDSDVYVKYGDGGELLVYYDEYEIHRKAGEEDVATVPTKATLHSREEVLPRHEVEAMPDAVNQPSHYTQGRFETIEIIEEITQGYSDGYVAYCVGNALKYLARAPFKHGEPTEDISKAAKYLEFALERLQSKSAPR